MVDAGRGRRKRRTKLGVLVSMSLLAASLASCGADDSSDAASGDAALTPITVAVSNAAIEHTPIYAAMEQQLFTKNGLEVKIEPLATGVEIANSVSSGDADFGVIGGVPTMTTAASGVPLKVIAIDHGDATATKYSPFQGIVSGPGTGIGEGEVAKLEGKKIGVPLGTGGVPYLQSVLQDAGVDLKKVEFVNVAPADALVALKQGDVDAVCLFQPFPSRAPVELPGSTVVLNGGSNWFDPGPIIAMEDTVSDRADVTEQFLTAVAEAEQWLRANRDDAAEISTHWITGLDLEVAQEALQHSNYDMRLSTNLVKGWTETTVPFLVSQDALPDDFDPASMIEAGPMYQVVTEHPDLFSDLPAVPDAELMQ
jgi:sulfonate transport system substrate-binding protein